MTDAARDEQLILIVDDMPENVSLMEEVLKTSYRVTGATNGEEALRIASAAVQTDLILLDVGIQGMDGHAVCQRLKDDPGTADIPSYFSRPVGRRKKKSGGWSSARWTTSPSQSAFRYS